MREKFDKLFGFFRDWKKNKEHIRWMARQGRPDTGHLAMLWR